MGWENRGNFDAFFAGQIGPLFYALFSLEKLVKVKRFHFDILRTAEIFSGA